MLPRLFVDVTNIFMSVLGQQQGFKMQQEVYVNLSHAVLYLSSQYTIINIPRYNNTNQFGLSFALFSVTGQFKE